MKTLKTLGKLGLIIVGSACALAGTVLLGVAGQGCYPKNCDPNTDPLKCQCPPGDPSPCAHATDAGPEGGK